MVVKTKRKRKTTENGWSFRFWKKRNENEKPRKMGCFSVFGKKRNANEKPGKMGVFSVFGKNEKNGKWVVFRGVRLNTAKIEVQPVIHSL